MFVAISTDAAAIIAYIPNRLREIPRLIALHSPPSAPHVSAAETPTGPPRSRSRLWPCHLGFPCQPRPEPARAPPVPSPTIPPTTPEAPPEKTSILCRAPAYVPFRHPYGSASGL